MRFTHRVLQVLVALCASIPTVHAQCPNWTPTFASVNLSWSVYSSTVFDDGSGPALYVAGSFTSLYGSPIAYIARWDGTAWSALGSGVNGQVNQVTVYDDGFGPALYVSGSFSMAGGSPVSRVARWRGGVWSAVGAGPALYQIYGLIGFDDGSGPALYAYGNYILSATVSQGKIQRFDGSTWSDFGQFLGTGIGTGAGVVYDAVIHDDGFGPKLYAAGNFFTANGVSAHGMARLEGSGWAALSADLPSGSSAQCLTSFDDGSGLALYAYHYTPTPFGGRLSRWSGGTWADVGNGSVYGILDLRAHDDGTGPALYACGSFTTIGGIAASGIARLSAGTWLALGSGIDHSGYANTLTSHALGGAPRLFAGGSFSLAGGISAHRLAEWNGSTWSSFGPSRGGLNAPSNTLAVHDDGTGPSLFIGGMFDTAGGMPAPHVVRWDGTNWHILGDGLDGVVHCLARHDEGAGPVLFAGGAFTHSGVTFTNNVARWDGSTWNALATGPGGQVRALCSFDDGSGLALCAAGSFPGGTARWNGSSWSAMGAGFNGVVESLGVWDDGNGPKLYAGGAFSTLGGSPVSKVVRWNGTGWSSVGPVGGSGTVSTLHVHDDGNGSRLYAGGTFTALGGLGTAGLAAFDGTAWTTVGGANVQGGVLALTSWDDGSGNALYAAGAFTNIGSVMARGIARFDGVSWTSLAGSLEPTGIGRAVAAYRPSSSTEVDLFVGGGFDLAGGVFASYLAHWRGCGHAGAVVCAGDGSVGPCPCGNTGLTGHGCDNSAASGGAELDSSGWNSIAFDSLVLTSSHQIAAGLCVFVQGTQSVGPLPFGDGLLCTGGSLKRLYLKFANAGVAVAPAAGEASITAQSLQSGDALAVGSTRVYQVYYRDADLSFCTASPASAFNLSNALRLTWTQ